MEHVRRRRSREEADRLVVEYERSGMTREAFCRQQGLSAATLDNYRKRRRGGELSEGVTGGQRPSSGLRWQVVGERYVNRRSYEAVAASSWS